MIRLDQIAMAIVRSEGRTESQGVVVISSFRVMVMTRGIGYQYSILGYQCLIDQERETVPLLGSWDG